MDEGSGAKVLVCLQSLYRDVAAAVVGGTDVGTVITTSELDFQTRNDPRAFPGAELLFGVLLWGGTWLAGDRTRLRRERMAELEERALRAEREAESERRLAAAEERGRIARGCSSLRLALGRPPNGDDLRCLPDTFGALVQARVVQDITVLTHWRLVDLLGLLVLAVTLALIRAERE